MRALAVFCAAGVCVAGAHAASRSATVTWETPSAVRGSVAYGVGGLYLWSPRETTAATAHSVTLTDLAPGTTYTYRAGATTGTITTPPAPPQASFATDGTRITADGSLFFPILAYEQCAATISRALAVGINVFVQVPFTGCTQPAGVTPPYVLTDTYDTARGAGWYLPDEPDGWGIAPDRMPRLAAAPGRLRVLNISQHFYSGQAPINDSFDRADYKRYTALADVVGFDMYPIVKFCGRVSLLDMFRAQRELMTIYAPGKPTFQWIETSAMTGECPSLAVTPAIVKAETWLAVAGGACGIGYFTNSWTARLWNRWDFDPGVEAALPALVAGVERLAPALCDGTYGSVLTPWDGTVVATSRELNGALYVIAVNGSDHPTTVPFRVDDLRGRRLTVLGESRTITVMKQVFFRDSFAPYGVHVYVAAP